MVKDSIVYTSCRGWGRKSQHSINPISTILYESFEKLGREKGGKGRGRERERERERERGREGDQTHSTEATPTAPYC